MPVVNIKRDSLFKKLGKTYTDEEFDTLCFEFGIELDEVTSQKEMLARERATKGSEGLEQDESVQAASEDVIYKIEIPANRYDLLCEEGLVRALSIFTKKIETPVYRIKNPNDGNLLTTNVKSDTAKIRPFVVCAVLRGIKFTQDTYDNFIDLQDKLHHNICRKRTLVAIGTHDLDNIKAPFSYEALPPNEIEFVPLSQTQSRRADNLMKLYEEDPTYKHLKAYVPIIKDSDVYPVIYDANRNVLSLPPIINGEYSKISLNTRNVFIECTATDHTKAKVVLNTMVTMFSEYCEDPFTVEQVRVVYPDGRTVITPDLSNNQFECKLDFINSRIGINIEIDQAVQLLRRMQLGATAKDNNTIHVTAPPTRSDVLHACDIMEDVAISYGYNNIVRTKPKTATVGKEDPLNAVSDLLRLEMAMAGYTEVLTLSLCSHQENFDFMRKKDDGNTAVRISNPQTQEFQVCRTSLLPGILKTIERNVVFGLPLQLFEVSDVVMIDSNKDVGASNRRHLAAAFCGKTSGLEQIHGLMDRLMEVQGLVFKGENNGYTIVPSGHPTYFSGRQADIFVDGEKVGSFGILHPEVLESFKIKYPCSVLEVDIERIQKL